MAIKLYTENSKKLYEVSVGVRSKLTPSVRKQKRKRNIPTRAEAKRLERVFYKECYEYISQLDGQGLYWGRICEKWQHFKMNDTYEPLSPQTITDNFNCLKKYTHEHWNKPAMDLNRGDVKRIFKAIESDGRSKKLQARVKASINKVFRWGMEEGLIKNVHQSPTHGIAIKRKCERVSTILNKDEIKTLLRSAKDLKSPWYSIWSVAILTGCRSGELFALTWNDIDMTKNEISINKSYNNRLKKVKSTKSGYNRIVPINQELKDLLIDLKKNSNTIHVLPRLKDWINGYQARVLKLFCSGLRITPIRFHDLRACFATQLLLNNVAPITVMKIAGWKDLDTMQRYVRLSGIDERGATQSLSFLSS